MIDALITVLIVCAMFAAVVITLWVSISIIVFMIDSFKSVFHKDGDCPKDKK